MPDNKDYLQGMRERWYTAPEYVMPELSSIRTSNRSQMQVNLSRLLKAGAIIRQYKETSINALGQRVTVRGAYLRFDDHIAEHVKMHNDSVGITVIGAKECALLANWCDMHQIPYYHTLLQ